MEFINFEGEKIKHISPIKFRKLKKTIKLLMSPLPKKTKISLVKLDFFEVGEFGIELLADVYYLNPEGKNYFHETIQTFSG